LHGENTGFMKKQLEEHEKRKRPRCVHKQGKNGLEDLVLTLRNKLAGEKECRRKGGRGAGPSDRGGNKIRKSRNQKEVERGGGNSKG